MVVPAIKEQILNDLGKLPPEQQQRAADLVRSMVPQQLPKGTPGRDLMRFAGTLDDESAREMMALIEQDCGRVDPDEW